MAKKFNYRLEKVFNIKKVKEKLALAELNKQVTVINKIDTKISDSHKNIYFSRLESSQIGQEETDVKMNMVRDSSIKGEETKIIRLEKEKLQALEHKKKLELAHNKTLVDKKKYEKHKEIKKDEHKANLLKSETKFLDEISSVRKKDRGIL